MNSRALKIASMTLLLFAFVYSAVGFYRLAVSDQFPFACDLKLRWSEGSVLSAGKDPTVFSDPKPNYPPWSYAMGLLLVPPLPEYVMRTYFAVLNLFALAYLIYVSGKTYKASGALLIACGLIFSSMAYLYCLSTGQYGILITAFLAAGLRFSRAGKPAWAGLAFALALIKPQLSILFLTIPLIHRQWRTLLSTSLWIFLFTAVTMLITSVNPFTMLVNAANNAKTFMVQSQGLMSLLPSDNGTALLTYTAICFIIFSATMYAARSLDLSLLCAISAVFSLLWTYHKAYDNILLFFLVTAVIRTAESAKNVFAPYLAIGIGIFFAIPIPVSAHNITAINIAESLLTTGTLYYIFICSAKDENRAQNLS